MSMAAAVCKSASAALLSAALLMAAAQASAQASSPPVPKAVQALPAPAASSPSLQFKTPVVLRGMLGDQQVQVQLRPKPEGEDGLEGDYFLFGASQKVLLAGEVDGPELVLEESENGKDVSGQWIGTLDGDRISGTWTSVDNSVSKSFLLQPVAMSEQIKRLRGRQP